MSSKKTKEVCVRGCLGSSGASCDLCRAQPRDMGVLMAKSSPFSSRASCVSILHDGEHSHILQDPLEHASSLCRITFSIEIIPT